MDEEDIDGMALVAKAGAAGFAALVAAAEPTLGVVAAGALPFVDAGIERVRQYKRDACGYTIQVAADVAGLPLQDLIDRLTTDSRRALLLAHALESASETALQEKMHVLGNALANGALFQDDARVMEEIGWVKILRDIEAPHLRMIEYLLRDDPERHGNIMVARREKLKEVSGFEELIGPALRAMERDGLVRERDVSDFDTATRARWGMSESSGGRFYTRGELTQPCMNRFTAAKAK